MNPYAIVLLSNFSFAVGAQFFEHFGRTLSSQWVNYFKSLVAAPLCLATLFVLYDVSWPRADVFIYFFVSGILGLGAGDYFLIKAFEHIGTARTLTIFGFGPIVVGVTSYFVLGQEVDMRNIGAIGFFLCCLFIFSLESYRRSGKWEFKGILYALLGVSLDGIGVVLSRVGFDLNLSMNSFEGNLYRCLGAIFMFQILNIFFPFGPIKKFVSLTNKARLAITFGAIVGTYIALAMYLSAIQTANLATVTALSITSVLFSGILECIWTRTRPSVYLLVAFVFLALGLGQIN